MYFTHSCFDADNRTRPLGLNMGPDLEFGDQCPSPPLLEAGQDSQSTGPLNSHNHFVDEHLLRRAEDLERSVFFRRIQAGFVFASNEPTEGDCVQADFIDIVVQPPSKIYNSTESVATIWYNNQVRGHAKCICIIIQPQNKRAKFRQYLELNI